MNTQKQNGAAPVSLRVKPGAVDLAPPLTLRVNTACDMLGISRSTFYQAVATGKIRLIKLFGRTLVTHDELLRVIAAAEAEAA